MRNTLSLLALIASLGAAHAAGPFERFKLGNWSGGSYTNNTTKAFSHCAASTPYRSGILFLVGVTKDMKWTLGFLHPQWRLKQGERLPVQFIFDERRTITLTARAISATTVLVPMPNTSELVSAFRQSRMLRAVTRDNSFRFRLDGTSRLLPELVNCVRRGRSAPRVAAVAPRVPSSLPAAAPAAPSGTSSELQLEALRLATNFVLQARLSNARILDKKDFPTQLASYGAAWKANEMLGAVKIIPTAATVKGIDVAAEVVAADARECKGKFASGRTSELVDDEIVFRGFSSCEDSAGSRTSQYLVVPRRKGGFVMFSLGGAAKVNAPGAGASKDDQLATFRRAALSSVNN